MEYIKVNDKPFPFAVGADNRVFTTGGNDVHSNIFGNFGDVSRNSDNFIGRASSALSIFVIAPSK